MLALVIQDHPHRPLTHLGCVPRQFVAHGSILSRFGASGKAGAIQCRQAIASSRKFLSEIGTDGSSTKKDQQIIWNTMKSNPVKILEVDGYGAVDSWTWIATLYKNKDETFSVSLVQVPHDEEDAENCFETMRLNSFLDGYQLFEFLDSSWHEAHENCLSMEQWTDIAAEVAKSFPKLSSEILDALRRNRDE